jgi:hypothetical protein
MISPTAVLQAVEERLAERDALVLRTGGGGASSRSAGPPPGLSVRSVVDIR